MTHEHAPRRPGAVAVDIGPGRGALVVTTPPELCGQELEIAPAGDGARRRHVWVLRRATGAGTEVCAAVFGSLPAGVYRVLSPDGGCSLADVAVAEAAVAHLDLRLATQAS